MGVAHGYRADPDFTVGELQWIVLGPVRSPEWNLVRFELGHAHIHIHQPVFSQSQLDDAGAGFNADIVFTGQFPVAHEPGEAARTIAALLDFTAVGVVDAIAKINIGIPGRFDHEHLVTADAAATVSELADMGCAQLTALADQVEHDKVIAEAVHLGEL